MLKNYVAPNGRTYQYEEGSQPKGYRPAMSQRPTKDKRAAPKSK